MSSCLHDWGMIGVLGESVCWRVKMRGSRASSGSSSVKMRGSGASSGSSERESVGLDPER